LLVGPADTLLGRLFMALAARSETPSERAIRGAEAPWSEALECGVRLVDTDVASHWRDGVGLSDLLGPDAGPFRGVVLTALTAGSFTSMSLMDHEASDWFERVVAPLDSAVAALQGAYQLLRDEGGSIVVLISTDGLFGVPGSVASSSLAEGQRGLAKGAARQFGADGIRVNCVAIDRALASDGTVPMHREPLVAPCIVEADIDQLADVVIYLLSDDARGVTGATLCVDGGTWIPA
jgi:3-oxoacyl-[acyl-carrier protein] reductase